MREVEVSKEILIIGENEFAKKCKENLENLGFQVYLIKGNDLVSVKGVVGNFEVKFKKNGSISKVNAGAIVIAEIAECEVLKDEINIERPDLIITQSKLMEILDSGKKPPKNICFFLGDASQISKVATYNCLKSSLILRENLAAEVFVLCRDLKIAGNGMEKLYRRARSEGVVFLKYLNKPEFIIEEDKIKIRFEDCYLQGSGKTYVEISCDLLVVDELFISDDNLKKLSSILNIGSDSKNFLQYENINLYPVLTNRKGIFVVGTSHNPDLLDSEILNEINTLSEEIYNLLSSGKLVIEERLKVNPEKCAVCLTCIRSCPHKSIDLVEDLELNKKHAFIFNEACYACGVCISLCPAGAIEFKEYDDKNIFNLLEVK